MDHLRKSVRYYLHDLLKVYDDVTNEFFGYLQNISPEGAMIFCKPFEEITQAQDLRIGFSNSTNGSDTLCFVATCQWYKATDEDGFVSAGFRFKTISDQSKDILDHFLKVFSFTSYQ